MKSKVRTMMINKSMKAKAKAPAAVILIRSKQKASLLLMQPKRLKNLPSLLLQMLNQSLSQLMMLSRCSSQGVDKTNRRSKKKTKKTWRELWLLKDEVLKFWRRANASRQTINRSKSNSNSKSTKN